MTTSILKSVMSFMDDPLVSPLDAIVCARAAMKGNDDFYPQCQDIHEENRKINN